MFSLDTRILVVDDMPSIRELVRNHLKAMGFKNIYDADDGDVALRLLVQMNAANTPIQLIICDWNMPNMTGLALLKQIRGTHEWAKTPFILLTSESEREQVTEAILSGANQYVVKPFSARIFEEKLTAVYNKLKSTNAI